MFAHPALNDVLTQGDVIDECPIVGLSASGTFDLSNPPIRWWTARVIVLTQACDLAHSKTDSVLVASVHDAQKLVDAGLLKGPVIRDQVRRHLVYGWYYLPAAPSFAIVESLIDLREVHSIPRVVLERLIGHGKRIATLMSPYREHLSQHFAVTYMRVALPEPYPTQP